MAILKPPDWQTASNLGGAPENSTSGSWKQVDATNATSYMITAGSLPAGLSFSSAGVLSGTLSGNDEPTTATFTITAISATSQSSDREFTFGVCNDPAGLTNSNEDASGIYSHDGTDYKWVKYTTTGNRSFGTNTDLLADVLIVAGGGGGGDFYYAGGGGAGGLRWLTEQVFSSGSHTVTVGAGGAVDNSGADSEVCISGNITESATGGGHGGKYETTTAADGGSGGGMPHGSWQYCDAGKGNIGNYDPPEGYDGGGRGVNATAVACGGGGAGQVGGIAGGGDGGGQGRLGGIYETPGPQRNTSDIWKYQGYGGHGSWDFVGDEDSTGAFLWATQLGGDNRGKNTVDLASRPAENPRLFLAGGGGGASVVSGTGKEGKGGYGGGAHGAQMGTDAPDHLPNETASLALPNSGGGGGGASHLEGDASAGASGVVVIRYKD